MTDVGTPVLWEFIDKFTSSPDLARGMVDSLPALDVIRLYENYISVRRSLEERLAAGALKVWSERDRELAADAIVERGAEVVQAMLSGVELSMSEAELKRGSAALPVIIDSFRRRFDIDVTNDRERVRARMIEYWRRK